MFVARCCVGSRGFETAGARFEAAVCDVDRLSVRCDVVEEGTARNLDLAVRLSGLAIEFAHDREIGDVELVADNPQSFRCVQMTVGG